MSYMSNDDEEALRRKEYLVVKSNRLIQKSRFELSLPEQKTIAYICSLIKPINPADAVAGVPYQLEYEFNVREYCKVCGIDEDNGKNYSNIKNILKGLRDKSMWITLPNGETTTLSWLSKATISKGSGHVRIVLDPDMVPYLFNLKTEFVAYQLMYVTQMQSKFSPRLYELFRSYAWQKNICFELDELKHLLMIEDKKSYERFPDFRRFVLEPAVREVNAFTDIQVEFEFVKKGRKVTHIKFKIQEYRSIIMQHNDNV